MDKFNGIDSKVLRLLHSLPETGIVLLLAIPFVIAVGISMKRRSEVGRYFPAFFAGWYGITFQLLLLVSYQSVAGNLYSRLGMLAGLFMAGMAGGAWLGSRAMPSSSGFLKSAVFAGLALSVICAATVPPMLGRFGERHLIEMVLMLLSVLAGGVPGTIFSLSLQDRSEGQSSDSPGRFYAADLIGAAFGGLFTSMLILPLLGILFGFATLAALSVLVLCYLYRSG